MGFKLAIAMFFVLASLAGVGYWYYNDTQERIRTLQQNNAKLETAIQINEASIKTMQADAAKNAALTKQLQTDLQQAERYGDELRNTLQKHNLTALAQRKPELIEKRMQDATNKLWADLRSITDPNRVRDTKQAGTKDSNSN
jgi:cell division protein FtsB